MVTKETAAKRKKTAEMPDSPPKRVTRARAAKIADDTEPQPRVTKITTASVKAAAGKKKAAAPAMIPASKTGQSNATKRKAKADEEVKMPVQEGAQSAEAAEQLQEEPPKSRARQKKAVAPAKTTAEVDEMPKLRGKQAAISKAEDAPKTRGRPKKTADDNKTVAEEKTEEAENSAPARKTNRGRAAASSRTAAAAIIQVSISRKRVQFQEEPDKENVPIENAGPKKSAMKATGLKAKPVRKPAVPRTTTRGRKALNDVAQNEEGKQVELPPLSPKKVFQLAKAGSASSEDELAGEKMPIRSFSHSPTKFRISPVKDTVVVAKLDFSQVTAPSSPSKSMASSVMGSPARRPPQSPFKDSLKSSPKKLNFSDRIAQPALSSSGAPIALQKSLLQESPKKGKFGDSNLHTMMLPAQTPHKASLLQSSPRRPMVSPAKANAPASPTKAGSDTPALQCNVTHTPKIFPQEAVSSPLRAKTSPEPVVKDYKMTEEEQQMAAGHQEAEKVLPASPTKQMVTAPSSKDVNVKTGVQQPANTSPEVTVVEEDVSIESPSPMKTMALFNAPTFSIPSSNLRRISVESQSDDELASPDRKYAPTPLRKHAFATKYGGTPSLVDGSLGAPSEDASMTPLVDHLSTWVASSPSKQAAAGRSRQTRGMFSIGGIEALSVPEHDIFDAIVESPAKVSFFEDEMAVTNEQDDQSITEPSAGNNENCLNLEVSQESLASEDYGDENANPNDAEILRAEQDEHTLTCTPAKLTLQRPQEIHTVSKVPLRASAEDSPIRFSRQRSKSLGGLFGVADRSITDGQCQRRGHDNATYADADADMLPVAPATPVLAATTIPQTPNSVIRLDNATPGRTVRRNKVSDVLKGAVVYVDVHTTEGADASGIFVDLLTQMGARCVKQWNWNPRDTLGGSLDSTASPQSDSSQSSPAAAKTGITHVVYKDGGKRTLEKVRSSRGMVLCVGVGWVLDCEREDRWLNEAEYAIDTSIVPRGGSRRRKSMEPRALANLEGNLVLAGSETPAKDRPTDVSPTKEFMTFDTPASRRETFMIEPQQPNEQSDESTKPMPETPATPTMCGDGLVDDGSSWSPTTPYYLSKGAALIQRTCPPKRAGDSVGLFPISGNPEDQPDDQVRRRLLEARRKSLQWVSKTRSPLGRTVSYGK